MDTQAQILVHFLVTLISSTDGLTYPAKHGKLAVCDHWTANIPDNSVVAGSSTWLELYAWGLKAVFTDNEAATTILSVAFRVTDFQHLVERNCWLVWWLQLLYLTQQELRRVKTIGRGSRCCRELLAGFSYHKPNRHRSRGMRTMCGMYTSTNNAKGVCTGLMWWPSSALLGSKAWCTPIRWACEVAVGAKRSPVPWLENIMLSIQKITEWSSSGPGSACQGQVIRIARVERYVRVIEKSFTAKLRSKMLDFSIGSFAVLFLVWG